MSVICYRDGTGAGSLLDGHVPDGLSLGVSPYINAVIGNGTTDLRDILGRLKVPWPATQQQFDCYSSAAAMSATYMASERNQRLAAQGQPPVSTLRNQHLLLIDVFGRRYNEMASPADLNFWNDWAVSFITFLQDDVTAQDSSKVFQPMAAPDGILPYPPDRIDMTNLANTYNLLKQTEQNTLEVLAQSQSPQTVAQISTSLTVTDPIGRLVTGALVQSQFAQDQSPLVNPLAPAVLTNPGVPPAIAAGSVTGVDGTTAPAAAPAATMSGAPMLGLLVAVIPFLLPKS